VLSNEHALRNKLKIRLNDKFFGVGAQSVLRSDIFTEQMRQSIEADICIGLQKALSYLEQSFNFSSCITLGLLLLLLLFSFFIYIASTLP